MVELGALKALERAGIPIHMIAGSSTGAQVGLAYALNGSYEEAYNLIARFTRTQKQFRQQALDFSWLPWRGLIRGNGILKMFQEVAAEKDDFSKLKIPLRVVAAELDTGREVIFKEGSVSLALRGSSSIPGAFEPVEINGRYFVDGGVINPLPVNVLAEEGLDIIIAVLPQNPPATEAAGRNGWSRNFFNVLTNSLAISVNQMRTLSACLADVAIAPVVSDAGMFDFHRLDEMIALGEQATLPHLERIRHLIEDAARKPENHTAVFRKRNQRGPAKAPLGAPCL